MELVVRALQARVVYHGDVVVFEAELGYEEAVEDVPEQICEPEDIIPEVGLEIGQGVALPHANLRMLLPLNRRMRIRIPLHPVVEVGVRRAMGDEEDCEEEEYDEFWGFEFSMTIFIGIHLFDYNLEKYFEKLT